MSQKNAGDFAVGYKGEIFRMDPLYHVLYANFCSASSKVKSSCSIAQTEKAFQMITVKSSGEIINLVGISHLPCFIYKGGLTNLKPPNLIKYNYIFT
jgi:hypothetical protein